MRSHTHTHTHTHTEETWYKKYTNEWQKTCSVKYLFAAYPLKELFCFFFVVVITVWSFSPIRWQSWALLVLLLLLSPTPLFRLSQRRRRGTGDKIKLVFYCSTSELKRKTTPLKMSPRQAYLSTCPPSLVLEPLSAFFYSVPLETR